MFHLFAFIVVVFERNVNASLAFYKRFKMVSSPSLIFMKHHSTLKPNLDV
jgi:hypothetical protein